MKSSNLSDSPLSALCHLARGDMIAGVSVMNVGFLHSDSRYSPTSLSMSRAVDLGGLHSIPFSLHKLSKNYLAFSVPNSVFFGIFLPSLSFSYRDFIIGSLLNGGEKSISYGSPFSGV